MSHTFVLAEDSETSTLLQNVQQHFFVFITFVPLFELFSVTVTVPLVLPFVTFQFKQFYFSPCHIKVRGHK